MLFSFLFLELTIHLIFKCFYNYPTLIPGIIRIDMDKLPENFVI